LARRIGRKKKSKEVELITIGPGWVETECKACCEKVGYAQKLGYVEKIAKVGRSKSARALTLGRTAVKQDLSRRRALRKLRSLLKRRTRVGYLSLWAWQRTAGERWVKKGP